MERILVAIDGRHGAWEALSHACSLAKRVQVLVYVLLVMPTAPGRERATDKGGWQSVKKRLELHLAAAKAEGLAINYFMTEGHYEDEVINFVNHHKIALLVHETRGKDARSAARDAVALRALRHRLTCKLEVVAPMKTLVAYPRG
ncbi:universal stress protein [Desulfobulbus sp.]|uniref:universal stress protein n=1 Tax=Desulfobulbus sp. TaxID=895 RepID=UPI00286F65AC|nr:universal stress protein [Desulfobulbus sp.]